MKNLKKKCLLKFSKISRSDWLAKWIIMLQLITLRWPRVFRRSNVGLVYDVPHWIRNNNNILYYSKQLGILNWLITPGIYVSDTLQRRRSLRGDMIGMMYLIMPRMVLKAEYSRWNSTGAFFIHVVLTVSIWFLLPWAIAPAAHQRSWFWFVRWLFNKTMFLPSMNRGFNNLNVVEA